MSTDGGESGSCERDCESGAVEVIENSRVTASFLFSCPPNNLLLDDDQETSTRAVSLMKMTMHRFQGWQGLDLEVSRLNKLSREKVI